MKTVKEYFFLLRTIYIGLFIASVLLLITALVTIEPNRYSEYDMPYIVSCLLFMTLAYVLAYFYTKKKVKEAKQKRGIREKLTDYRKALIIPWIIIDCTVIYSIICYLITGEHFFVCTVVFSLVLFLLNNPSPKNLITRLDLASDEQKIIENPKSAL